MKLINGKTGLSTRGTFSYSKIASIKTMIEETFYHQILTEFPIAQPVGVRKEVKHSTEHFIATTQGQPEACRLRRLAPDKRHAKMEFDLML